MAHPELRGKRWHDLRRQVLTEEHVCWICGSDVFYTNTRNHPLYPTVDHVIPRRDGGPTIRANLRLAHHGCNSARTPRRRAPRQPTQTTDTHTRHWLT